MLWVWVFLGIALAGIVMLAAYGVWLYHLATDLWSEVGLVLDQAGRLAELIGQIGAPEAVRDPAPGTALTLRGEVDEAPADVG